MTPFCSISLLGNYNIIIGLSPANVGLIRIIEHGLLGKLSATKLSTAMKAPSTSPYAPHIMIQEQ